ncbi:hypothetical protein AB0B66_30055 [Catellatospora sp. NPDC049111]|uniref:hypothetical protein n=1 Tax=Catellatospora sp. NPDC049111 TaxID=3155271 RepID=UPI0033C3D884
MTWTFKRMLWGLAAAALLGAAAYAVFALGAQQRQRVVDQGLGLPAKVVATHDSRWADSSDVTYRVDGHADRARLYGRWDDKLEIGTTITVYQDPRDRSRVVTADGFATDVSTMWPMPLSVFAGALALAAVTGWLSTARRRRWDEVTLDPEPDPDLVPRRRRGVVRRVDVFTRAVFGVLAAVLVVIVWLATWDELLGLAAGVTGACMAAMYLLGMAHKIVVTPSSLAVFQTFRVHRVPRHLVEAVHLGHDGVLELSVRGAKVIHIPTGAASTWGAYLNRRPAQLRAANRLRRLLVAVPPVVDDQPVTTSARYPMIGLAVLTAAAFGAPMAFIAATAG